MGRLTHSYDIAGDGISERKIASDGNQYINKERKTNASKYNASSPEMRIIADLIQD